MCGYTLTNRKRRDFYPELSYLKRTKVAKRLLCWSLCQALLVSEASLLIFTEKGVLIEGIMGLCLLTFLIYENLLVSDA